MNTVDSDQEQNNELDGNSKDGQDNAGEENDQLDELILMDEVEQAERENQMAVSEDAEILEQSKIQEADIERQMSKLARDTEDKIEAKEAAEKAIAEQIDLDRLKNEFRDVDFHP